ncbi:hypothetical protein VCHA34P129_100146 [Vibrio chagasii]|nr:hypothetical protein VCHA34P129_100146 [Vibrio chagasii]CAH6916265.1 hypothetical protein VCHA52P455_100160 [Vibrio chagasii]
MNTTALPKSYKLHWKQCEQCEQCRVKKNLVQVRENSVG